MRRSLSPRELATLAASSVGERARRLADLTARLRATPAPASADSSTALAVLDAAFPAEADRSHRRRC